MNFSRRRSPRNAYKPNSMGIGAPASRISPDGSVRGHGLYNSEFRNFSRGFGRSQPKPYQVPHPPPKYEVFMEAGRLAAEYLVCKGFLPLALLPPNWQNNGTKKPLKDFQELRLQDGEDMLLSPENRTSPHAHLPDLDVGASRKRFPGEYNTSVSTNILRGRRKIGSRQNHCSDWGHENGRSGSLSDKAWTSLDKEADDDVSRHQENLQGMENSGGCVQNLSSTELVTKGDGAGYLGSELEIHQSVDDIGSKASCSASMENCSPDTVGEISKKAVDLRSSDMRNGENNVDAANEETKKRGPAQELLPHIDAVVDGPCGKTGTDLLRLCNFAKVPTRTRSSLTSRGLKVETPLTDEAESHCDDNESSKRSRMSINMLGIDESLDTSVSSQVHMVACNISDISRTQSVQSVNDAQHMNLAYATKPGNCIRSQSLLDNSFIHDHESGHGPRETARCSSLESIIKGKGEKRVIQQNDNEERSKKSRQWLPAMFGQADEHSHLLAFSNGQSSFQKERVSQVEEVIMVAQENSGNISVFPKDEAELCIGYEEEKQLLPSSFKICDLNLMESSDVNENHDSNPLLFYPTISQTKKEAAHVDISLSTSNNSNIPREHSTHAADSKDVEVINLENDSAEEDEPFENSEKRAEAGHTNLESFPNHGHNSGDIPDVQDRYGLMISELLGNDIPNCSSVSGDMTLPNEITLHSGEGMLSDDDPIYMSLGEIPISLLKAWEQPTQEYEKLF